MAAPLTSDNQASSSIQPGTGTTEVRLGNQASEYARRNGIPEITKGGNTAPERNAKDQTDITKISATLPGGETWNQNWLEKMRGEAKIRIPSPGSGMRSAQSPTDEARDRYLERYFTSRDASASTMRQFVGRKKMNLETPRKESPSPIIDEVMDTTEETREEEPQTPDYTNQPMKPQQAQPEADTSEAQAEIASGLSMGQVRKGLMGPAIATASTTGLISLLALSSSDTATAFLRSLTHLTA